MDLADLRIPNPEDVEGNYIEIPYIDGRITDDDGYWHPRILSKRYRKLHLSKSYTTWIEDREIND